MSILQILNKDDEYLSAAQLTLWKGSAAVLKN